MTPSAMTDTEATSLSDWLRTVPGWPGAEYYFGTPAPTPFSPDSDSGNEAKAAEVTNGRGSPVLTSTHECLGMSHVHRL